MSGPMTMDAESLRSLANLLDGLGRLERETGWTVCAYGPVSVAPVDESTTAIQVWRMGAGEAIRYVVEDRNGS